MDLDQGGAGGLDQIPDTSLELPELGVQAVQLVQATAHQLHAHPHLTSQQPPDQPSRSLGPQLRELVLVTGLQGDQVGMDPVGDPGPLPEQLLAVVDQQPQVLGQVLAADRWQVLLTGHDPGDSQRIGGIALPRWRSRRRSRTVNDGVTSTTTSPACTKWMPTARL
jgi:hypothetical protein